MRNFSFIPSHRLLFYHALLMIVSLLGDFSVAFAQAPANCSILIDDNVYNPKGGYQPYKFFHKDGTSDNVFYKGETIYSYAINTVNSCRTPIHSTVLYRTPNMPSSFAPTCTGEYFPYYTTPPAVTNCLGEEFFQPKKCPFLVGKQYANSLAERFEATTTGDFTITFNNGNGTTVNLTIIERFAIYTDCGNLAGNYNETGTRNGKKKFVDADGNELYYDDSNARWVISGSMGIAYSVASTADAPPLTGWQVENSGCIGHNIRMAYGEEYSITPLVYDVSVVINSDKRPHINGVYYVTSINKGRPVLTNANGKKIEFLSVFAFSAWAVDGGSFNGANSTGLSMTVPTTCWDARSSGGSYFFPPNEFVVTQSTTQLAIPMIVSVQTNCGNYLGTYTQTKRFNERPDLQDEDQNRLFYWGIGDPNHPEGWYIADANNKFVFYNTSNSTNPPTTGWQAFTGDGISCTGTLEVSNNAKIVYWNTSLCKSATQALARVIGEEVTGGTFSSTQGLSIDANTGTINPSTSTTGTYTISYNKDGAILATTSITIEDLKSPSVTIAASPSGSITAGKSVTFTATPTNGGTTPTYVWKKNDTVIPNETGATLTTTTLADGDKIKVEMTSNDACVSSTSATSNEIMVAVTTTPPCPPGGATWTARAAAENNSWSSVTYGNGQFVAVAFNGTNRVMTSPDGITWTARAATESNEWISVTYGNGLFAAVALNGTNRVMTSPDGITWTPRAAAENNTWRSITYGNGLFVAVASDGTNRVMTSTDGITWTPRAAENNEWISVTYGTVAGNGLFVAVAFDGTNRVMTSPDGITWTARAATENNPWISVTYGNGLFAAVAFDGTNRVMTSTDGITWTARAVENNVWRSITYGNGLFVAVALNGTNRVMTSTDGITWTTRTAAENNSWRSVTYGNGQFVAVAASGTNYVMTSPDGIRPSVAIAANPSGSITAGTSVTFMATPTNGGTTPSYVWKKNGNTVGTNSATYTDGALANNDKIKVEMTSNDACASPALATSNEITVAVTCPPGGATWTARAAVENNAWYSVTYGNGLFVAVAFDGTNRVMTSPDGITWTARAAAENNSWNSVSYGNGLFVAVATGGTNRVMTSPDGINWTARAAAENNAWRSVTYGTVAGNGLFVAVAASGTNRVMTSPDGITWTARTTAENNSWSSVTYGTVAGNGLFVAVATTGTNRVMTSPDGINWTARAAAGNNNWTSLTYGNGQFVAVAYGGTNRVMTSTDGINWTARAATENNAWWSVTYGNGQFVAVAYTGTNRVMTSPDGITWTARTAAENNDWLSVTYGNGQFVAVAETGTNRVMTSPDGVRSSVAIAANPSGSITAGTSVTFTATPTNGGTTPSYVWKKNGNTVGTNSATYTDGALANNDKIKVEMTSNDACASPTVAISNEITMAVTTPCPPGGATWTARAAAENNYWYSVTYGTVAGNGLFVAVAYSGTNRVMTSPDGINWTARAATENNSWNSVTYGNGLFVAVAVTGTNRVMTSPDGINWTARAAAENNSWNSVTYGNGLFVAVAVTGTNRVMTSPDGINWTARAAAENNTWRSITYGTVAGNGLFVAVAENGINRVMTSPDGITWTARTAAENNKWNSVTYGNGLFVAVAYSGTNRVMTSPDGITWTARTAAEK